MSLTSKSKSSFRQASSYHRTLSPPRCSLLRWPLPRSGKHGELAPPRCSLPGSPRVRVSCLNSSLSNTCTYAQRSYGFVKHLSDILLPLVTHALATSIQTIQVKSPCKRNAGRLWKPEMKRSLAISETVHWHSLWESVTKNFYRRQGAEQSEHPQHRDAHDEVLQDQLEHLISC